MGYDLMKMKGSRTSQIHVGYLSLFYYYGIVGGTLYLFFAFYLLKKLYSIAKKTGYWGSFYAFLTYFISVMGTTVSFQIYFVGYIFAMVFHRFYEQEINLEFTNRRVDV